MYQILTFCLTVLIWIVYSKLVYQHFNTNIDSKFWLVRLFQNKLDKFIELDKYSQIGLILSATHAILSLFGSTYMFWMIEKNDIVSTYLYHIMVAVSISHYMTDMIIVGFTKPQYIYVAHHIAATILIITYYIYANMSPITYSYSMIIAEITNPFQLAFIYLNESKLTNKKRYFCVNTIFTFIFTFVRTLIIPFIYLDLKRIAYNDFKLSYYYATVFEVCIVSGMIGGLMWNYNLIKGYYKKVYLPLMNNKPKKRINNILKSD
jgi:hypothetical protein